MSQHTCGRCRAVLSPMEVVHHASAFGLLKAGTSLKFRCACGNSFTILSEGRSLLLLTIGGTLALGGLGILGMGPGDGPRALKGLVGFLLGAVTFAIAARARLAWSRNPPVAEPQKPA